MSVTSLTTHVGQVLGDGLLGLYVIRSRRFLAVTSQRLDAGQVAALAPLHAGSKSSELPGSYAPAEDLRSPMTVGRRWVSTDEVSGALTTSTRDNTLRHRWVVRALGVAALGPAPETYIAPVTAGALRAEMVGAARARAEHVEERPELLRDPHDVRNLLLDSCEAWYVAVHGAVAPPMSCLAWAREQAGPEHRLVLDSLYGGGGGLPVDAASAREVSAFVWEVHRLVGAATLDL